MGQVLGLLICLIVISQNMILSRHHSTVKDRNMYYIIGVQDISIRDMTKWTFKIFRPGYTLTSRTCTAIEIHKIPVKSHVYESIPLPVRHYDFKIFNFFGIIIAMCLVSISQ